MTGTSDADLDLSGGPDWDEVATWLVDTALSGFVGAALSAGVAIFVLRRSWAHQEQRRREDREQEEERRAEDRRLEDERRQAQWDRERDFREDDRLQEQSARVRAGIVELERLANSPSPAYATAHSEVNVSVLTLCAWAGRRFPTFASLLQHYWIQVGYGVAACVEPSRTPEDGMGQARTKSALNAARVHLDLWLTNPEYWEGFSDAQVREMILSISFAIPD